MERTAIKTVNIDQYETAYIACAGDEKARGECECRCVHGFVRDGIGGETGAGGI